MKIIHTADWHLGQTFYEYDRKGEHARFLEWLREQVKICGIDVLLVAGDVFDSPNPSAEAQKMYYRFLCEITAENPDLQIIIIAGNHDSAARLEAPSSLLENLNIQVRGVVKRNEEGEIDLEHFIVPLNKGGYCLAVPYLRQGDCPESISYAQGVQKIYQLLYDQIKESKAVVIAMGHLQAVGSEISENDRSERSIIGGLECISPDSFASEIAYTALGHLHRAQQVSKRKNLRYSGAPIPMSFAEKNNKQGVVLIDIAESVEIEHLAFDAPVKLLSIPRDPLPLAEVLEEISKLPDGEISETSAYLEIKILMTEPEPSLRYQIEKALETKSVNLARIVNTSPKRDIEDKTISYEELQTIKPMEMALDIFKRRYAVEDMPQKMKTLLESVIKEVER